MPLFDRLYPASFKGARFDFIEHTMNAGRKTVTHEFPNKDYRYIEDLGAMLPTFSINGIIKDPFYEDKKATFEDALNDPGPGVLIHPFLGNLNCVSLNYTVNESLKNLGRAEYNINFAVAGESIYPTGSIDNTSKISALYYDVYDSSGDDLNNQYSTDYIRNITLAAEKLIDLASLLIGISSSIGAINTSNTDFKRQVDIFTKNSFKISSGNGDIGGNISDLLSKFDSLSLDGQTRFDANSRLLGFGQNDEFRNIRTAEIVQRNNNLKLINGTINALAFNNMIDSSKNISYRDEDQLNEVVDAIDKKYDFLLNNSTLKLSNTMLDNIYELRTQSRKFFEQQRLLVNKIIEIETNTIPMTVLAYQYYGSTDNYDELLSVNSIFNPARVSGTIKILES